MKVEEVLDMYDGKYADVEVYRFVGANHHIHTDTLSDCLYNNAGDGTEYSSLDEISLDEVAAYSLMDEKEYNRTILANCCEKADFSGWYDDPQAKVLVIVKANRMVKVIDTLDYGENMGYCKPFVAEINGSVYTMSVFGTDAIDLRKNGEPYDGDIKAFAMEVNDDYHLYKGWDDAHIAEMAMKEVGCDDCPSRDVCEAVQEEVEELK